MFLLTSSSRVALNPSAASSEMRSSWFPDKSTRTSACRAPNESGNARRRHRGARSSARRTHRPIDSGKDSSRSFPPHASLASVSTGRDSGRSRSLFSLTSRSRRRSRDPSARSGKDSSAFRSRCTTSRCGSRVRSPATCAMALREARSAVSGFVSHHRGPSSSSGASKSIVAGAWAGGGGASASSSRPNASGGISVNPRSRRSSWPEERAARRSFSRPAGVRRVSPPRGACIEPSAPSATAWACGVGVAKSVCPTADLNRARQDCGNSRR